MWPTTTTTKMMMMMMAQRWIYQKTAKEFVIWAHKKALEREKCESKKKFIFFFSENWSERIKLFVSEKN